MFPAFDSGFGRAVTTGAGQMILVENLRFWPEEEANDTGFAENLAKYGAFYVNDAFSCAHRAMPLPLRWHSICRPMQGLP